MTTTDRQAPMLAQAVPEFRPVAVGGFGDRSSGTAHSMAWFRDGLYVGVTMHRPPPLGQRNARGEPASPARASTVPGPGERGQIWRYEPGTDRWTLVQRSPLLRLRDGRLMPREVGYRGMVVFQGPSDAAPALYLSTISTLGSLILRSEDGETFAPVSAPGLGDPRTRSLRSLLPFQGRLYTSPTGRTGAELLERNLAETPVVLETDDPATGGWRPVSATGFGDAGNQCIFELAAFNGFLYAGTFNPSSGFQVWKTDASGSPYRWSRVVTGGAFRGNANESVASMMPFRGALYVGSGLQGLGYDRAANAGPAAVELIRIHPDDRWDLVVGEGRPTPAGAKRPLSGHGPGFGNKYNSVFWRMVEHEGWLYLGTNDWSVFLGHVAGTARSGQPVSRWHQHVSAVIRREGGFDLFRTRDGERWEPVTTTGFGSPYNYGVRTLCSTPAGLFLGTVTMVGSVPALEAEFPDHVGGCEVWLLAR